MLPVYLLIASAFIIPRSSEWLPSLATPAYLLCPMAGGPLKDVLPEARLLLLRRPIHTIPHNDHKRQVKRLVAAGNENPYVNGWEKRSELWD